MGWGYCPCSPFRSSLQSSRSRKGGKAAMQWSTLCRQRLACAVYQLSRVITPTDHSTTLAIVHLNTNHFNYCIPRLNLLTYTQAYRKPTFSGLEKLKARCATKRLHCWWSYWWSSLDNGSTEKRSGRAERRLNGNSSSSSSIKSRDPRCDAVEVYGSSCREPSGAAPETCRRLTSLMATSSRPTAAARHTTAARTRSERSRGSTVCSTTARTPSATASVTTCKLTHTYVTPA